MAERRGCISAITASELLFGVHRAESALRRARREEAVERVLAEATVLPFDLAAARVHARLAVDAAAAGIAIGAHDLIIAATAIAHDAPLLTLNIQEFRRIPGLRVETARAE
jgi:predicted nucleic acid-binding protein